MRVLVCGGRDFADSALLYGVLDELNRTKTVICVIEGDARGADRLAGQWARRNHIDLKVIVPEYDQFGAQLARAISGCSTKANPIWSWCFRAAPERKTWSGARSRRAWQYVR